MLPFTVSVVSYHMAFLLLLAGKLSPLFKHPVVSLHLEIDPLTGILLLCLIFCMNCCLFY